MFISTVLSAQPIKIVAAENFYGDIASQLGEPYVQVISILSNPNQDPHLFSTSPSTAKAIADANLIIYNGINYDAWMDTLLKPFSNQHKAVIVVANLMHKKPGDNPHIWYNPNTMLTYSRDLIEKLNQLDPVHADYYQRRFNVFKQQYDEFLHKISQLKRQCQGTPVIATEPIFNEMADALGLVMYGNDFQLSVMNETEPSAKEILDFQDKLAKKLVNVLIYNSQVINPLTEKIKNFAKKNGIAIVGITETQPAKQDYLNWMNQQLDNLTYQQCGHSS